MPETEWGKGSSFHQSASHVAMEHWHLPSAWQPHTRDKALQRLRMGVVASGLLTLFDISSFRLIEISIKTIP
jgi:hypothetical protein